MTATIGIMAALADFRVLAAALDGDGRTLLVDEAEAIAALRAARLDLLILCPRGDWWNEADNVGELRAAGARAHTNVMAMVPRGDVAALALAFDNGVADCVAYPFDAAEVAVRVRALLRRKAVADRLRAHTEEVRRLALTCPVTGLWNRHYLDLDLADKIERARTADRALALLMIDVDRFKPINDRHGHAIGDKVLRAVATRLGGGIRSNDTLARFGGDELVVVMPETGLELAVGVAERLRALVANGTTEVPFGITISIGAAELAPDEPAATLLAKADKALYAAKLAGRNRVAAAS